MEGFHTPSTERLFRAVQCLETEEECRRFLEDICTIREIQDMAQRLDTAILLEEGLNYHEIAQKVGISTATISRVSRALRYGSGGYREMLDKMKQSGEIGTCVRQYGTDTGRKTE